MSRSNVLISKQNKKSIKLKMERMTSPNYSNPNTPIQHTLALIKPDGMIHCDAIIKRILQAGFKICQSKTIKITPELASEFYIDRYEDKHYPLFVLCLSRGPARVMCLAKPKAIDEFKALIGMPTGSESKRKWPGSLRSYYACDVPNVEINAIHGSENLDMARKEIGMFFPNCMCEKTDDLQAKIFLYILFLIYSDCLSNNDINGTKYLFEFKNISNFNGRYLSNMEKSTR